MTIAVRLGIRGGSISDQNTRFEMFAEDLYENLGDLAKANYESLDSGGRDLVLEEIEENDFKELARLVHELMRHHEVHRMVRIERVW